MASGDLILFMDARQTVSANAARALVPYMADVTIGAATGELILSEDSSLEAANVGVYWRYEKWIRDNETRLTSITGATGALYIIRRKDYIPNIIGTILDDFETQAISTPGAICIDCCVLIICNRCIYRQCVFTVHVCTAIACLCSIGRQLRRITGYKKQGA